MRIQRTCARSGCGRVFSAKPSTIARGEGKYCSPTCAYPNWDIVSVDDLLARYTDPTPDPDLDCRLWTGHVLVNGYGQLNYRGRARQAHRLAFYLANDHWPTPQARHLCEGRYPIGDTTYRRCINPNHLAEGDLQANADDQTASGRRVRGERTGSARLNEPLVYALRLRHQAKPITPHNRGGGGWLRTMAKRLGVSHVTLSNAIKGVTWAHVPFP